MEEQDKWMEGLRNRLQNHSEPIPTGLWEQLEQELQGDTVGATPKVIPLWKQWQAVAAVAAMVVASTLTFLFWEQNSADTLPQQALIIQEGPITSEELPSSNEEVDFVEASQPMGAPIAGSLSTLAYSTPITPSVTATALRAYTQEEQTIEQEETYSLEEEPAKTTDSKPSTEAQQREEEPKYTQKKQFFTTAVPFSKKRFEKRTTLALTMGNMPTTATEAYGGYTNLRTRGASGFLNSPTASEATGVIPNYVEGTKEHALSSIVMNNITNTEVNSDVKHYAPITFGASLRFQLDKNWSLETGLTYTLLRSDSRSGGNDSFYEEQQRLHYIGIPLRAMRTLWENRNFEVYASAGGAVEKCVSGKLKTIYTVEGKEEVTDVESLSVKELQWSLSATAGAQYKVTPQMGFYIEPGVTYFFKDGSNVETIRKEHPFNFNLQLGFRVAF
ncbi:MAG: outer membrane beta-barrel protein [Phocaeicola sp.]